MQGARKSENLQLQILNSDLGDSGLKEEVRHGRWSEVGGCQSDGRHSGVPGTSIKVELNLEPRLLKGSDRWDCCGEIQTIKGSKTVLKASNEIL